MSLFGGSAFGGGQQNKPLFGASNGTGQNNQQGTLFGNTNNQQQQQQQQQQNQGAGSFGLSQNKAPANGVFGISQQQQQPAGNFFAGQTVFGTALQPPQGPTPLNSSSSVWQPPQPPAHWHVTAKDQKSIPDQMHDLLVKWSPDSPSTVFQHYFYNQVDPRTVPYYVAPPDEDSKAWEEALSKKPNDGAIPVLGRGFRAVAGRLETQAKAVEALQSRLHEMNNSLTEMLQKHDLELTVRATEAKRKHVALTKRCLQLATKTQILRNRGYAMDPREEELRKTLKALENKVFDPMLNGRQEEIWARMSAVRARARLLQEELEKIGSNVGKSESDQLDEEHVKAIKKVLKDFDQQLEHLRKELTQIVKEWNEWQESNKRVAHGR